MTAIVGLEHRGKVYVGGDSAQTVNGILNIKVGGKVFRSGEFVIGCAGKARLNDLVRYGFKPPPIKGDLDAYMASKFAAALRKAIEAAGALEDNEGGWQESPGRLLVGARGRLYEIDSCFAACREAVGYNAIGSGCEVALGAMYTTEGVKPEERIRAALMAAERWTTDVRGPFTVLSTK